MIVFLIGFMGCGKSRKGKELASKLHWQFIDLDAEIERRVGMTINSYFEQHGEQAFRKLEAECLRQLSDTDNVVVATGGGVPCFENNMDWMNATGTTVYLKMSPEALVSRLANRQKRPLIKDLDDQELLIFVESKMAERALVYEQAKFIVDGLNLSASDLIHQLNLS